MSNIRSGNSLTFDRFIPQHIRRLSDSLELHFGGQLSDVQTLLLISRDAVDDAMQIMQDARDKWLTEGDDDDD